MHPSCCHHSPNSTCPRIIPTPFVLPRYIIRLHQSYQPYGERINTKQVQTAYEEITLFKNSVNACACSLGLPGRNFSEHNAGNSTLITRTSIIKNKQHSCTYMTTIRCIFRRDPHFSLHSSYYSCVTYFHQGWCLCTANRTFMLSLQRTTISYLSSLPDDELQRTFSHQVECCLKEIADKTLLDVFGETLAPPFDWFNSIQLRSSGKFSCAVLT